MEALGINIFSLVIYILLFVVVYLLLEKYLFPSLRKSMAARKQLIAANVAKEKELAELETQAKQELRKEETEVLKAAKQRSDEIIANAETEAADIVKKAKQKATNYLNDSQTAVAAKQEKLEAEFKENVRSAAMTVAREVYGAQAPKIDPAKVAEVLANL